MVKDRKENFNEKKVKLIGKFNMKTLLLTVFGASIANIITFLLYQGFVQSYWGKNAVQEVTRFINRFCKHHQKTKNNEIVVKVVDIRKGQPAICDEVENP